MSYYKTLLLESEIRNFTMPSIPEYKMEEIDLEDDNNPRWYQKLFEMLKRMILWCKEKLIQLGKFISEKLGRWFKSKRISHLINRIKDARNFRLSKGHDVNTLFIHALNPYLVKIKDKNIYQQEFNKVMEKIRGFSISIESGSDIKRAYDAAKYATEAGGWWLLLNKQGKVRNINDIVSHTTNVIEYIKNPNISYDDIKSHYAISHPTLQFSEIFNQSKRFSDLAQPYLIPYCLDGNVRSETFNFLKDRVDEDSIYRLLDNFESEYRRTEKLSLNLIQTINKSLKEIEMEIQQVKNTTDYERYQNLIIKLDKYHLLSSLSYVPIYYLVNFTRLLDGLSNVLFSEKYLSTDIPPSNKIYHLSRNPDLGKNKNNLNSEYRQLIVDFPLSGKDENLPKRISFSPDPVLCCYGLSPEFPFIKDGRMERETFYLYEGVQVKGETRYIKPEIVRCAVSSDTHLSQEVCVTTDIEIRLIGEVEIVYNSSKQITEPDRYFVKLVKK